MRVLGECRHSSEWFLFATAQGSCHNNSARTFLLATSMRKRKSSPAGARPPGQKASTKLRQEEANGVTQDEVAQSAALRKATAEAGFYAKDSVRLGELIVEAREKINHIPRGPFAETWPYLMAMIRLLRAFHQGEYQDTPPPSLLTIIAAISYFVSPDDVIPDSVPIFGHIDDAMVLRIALKTVGGDLDTFMAWETSKV